MTINAHGYLTHCCALPHYQVIHVDDVSSLTDAFNNHPSFIEFRNSTPTPCQECFTRINGLLPQPLFSISSGKIRYLEFTSSNLCNATCSMCGEFSSSLWAGKVTRLSENAYDKIMDVLPDVEKLVIKGGEPLADVRNIKILERYLKVSNGTVDIITNGSLLPKCVLNTRVNLGVSIDGTHQLYNWIRSTDWDTVINNIKKFYQSTGNGVTVQSVISLYNFFNIEDYLKFFNDKRYVKRIEMNHWVHHPHHSSVQCLPEKLLLQQREKNIKIMEKYNKNSRYSLVDMSKLKYKNKKNCSKDKFFRRVSEINKMRGFDLLDVVPEIKEWNVTTDT